MLGGDHRHGKEPVAAAAAEDMFPEGMRVLAVDGNRVCRRVLEVLLCVCKFNPTVVTDARTALRMLREGGEEQFDLVIIDVHRPDMDGFKLVELICLEMDLPVIMLSVNGDKEIVLKGISLGACDYLVKPVHIKELKNIWKHVIRKKLGVVNHNSSESDGVDQSVHPMIAEGERGGTKSIKCSNKNKNDGDDSDGNQHRTSIAIRKKKRVSWTRELHERFLKVVNQLGLDNAVPMKILRMMNVDYLTRERVASHLQKHRLYLKRVTNDKRKSNPLVDSFERRSSSYYMNMNHEGNSSTFYAHHKGWPSSTLGSNISKNPYITPSVLGAQDAAMQSINWTMGPVDHGRSMLRHVITSLPDTRRSHSLGPPVSSLAKMAYHTKLDAFPPTHSSKAYAGVSREKLLEASNAVPTSNTGNSSFTKILNGGLLEPVNRFLVKPPESVSQFSSLMNAPPSVVGARRDAQFPYLVGSSRNPWHKNMETSSFPDNMGGTPLAQSHVNALQINQLQRFGASPGQMPMFRNEQQNQMAEIMNNNTTTMGAFGEQMTPLLNMSTNTAPEEMISDNFSPMTQMANGVNTNSPFLNLLTGNFVMPPTKMVNSGSINHALPDLQDRSTMPTETRNLGVASSILPVEEGPTDHQALNHQPNYNNSFFVGDILANMLNEDFNGDDALFGGEW